ncbi:transposase [Nonlabens spongiae]|uniref:transposase n=1 Tax=Nonlabens spongiae TaxID=331648 RepID=UPI002936FECD|nr:transposase [Nonlabens spongiae]
MITDSISYCRAEKNMDCFAFCVMPSHVHMIFRDQNSDPQSLLKNFKRYTARSVNKAIQNNVQESRRDWMLWMMKRAAIKNGNKAKHQFWQHHNKPIELWSPKVIKQKLDYIHNNPVESGFVTRPIVWKYSSARNYADLPAEIEIDLVGFME